MSITAFVPARSGSKRLPNKNISLLAGKPLVVWTLEACVNSDSVDEVIFSSDSIEYWNIAKKYIKSDKLHFHQRSNTEAGDRVKIFDYLKESVDSIFQAREGQFLMALPTMPLRTSSDIEEAISIYKRSGSPVFSAVEYDFAISFAFKVGQDERWEPIFDDSPMVTGNTRSQDQATAYHPNGAIYLRDINDLRDPNVTTIYQSALPMIMSRERSVDIDNLIDFKMAESLMGKI